MVVARARNTQQRGFSPRHGSFIHGVTRPLALQDYLYPRVREASVDQDALRGWPSWGGRVVVDEQDHGWPGLPASDTTPVTLRQRGTANRQLTYRPCRLRLVWRIARYDACASCDQSIRPYTNPNSIFNRGRIPITHDVCARRSDPRAAAEELWLRRLPTHGRNRGAAPDVLGVRARWLWRFLEEPTRHQTLSCDTAPDRPLHRARRGMGLVLHRPAVVREADVLLAAQAGVGASTRR
jgi:hypothetical protein